MGLPSITLDDKYELERGQLYLTGTQALVRLMIAQSRRDREAGLRTAGFVSGYRGSPVAAVDQQMWAAKRQLDAHDIRFHPGLNEDLAATSIWGTQQVGLWPGAKVDGVFSLWYGKGPGVDRSGDVFKHANHYGTSRHGGVLAVAGDDHGCKTTTVAAQNDYGFLNHSMPVLAPGNVQDMLDYGIYGFALSRFSGLWIALKVLADVIDTSTSLWSDPSALNVVVPEDVELPPDGLNIRLDEQYAKLDERIQRFKVPATKAFVRANGLDRRLIDTPRARIGIISYGKTAFDVLQALEDLGLDQRKAAVHGIRLLKLALTWPVDEQVIRSFAQGLDEIIVVEDRLPIVEQQITAILYNAGIRPRVVGKTDETGRPLFKAWADLGGAEISLGLARRLEPILDLPTIAERRGFLEAHEGAVSANANNVPRKPYYCSGCPHNTSTKVIEGSRAIGGVGCHYISTWIADRRTEIFTQMGGEGVVWIGQAPYREEPHIFANLGDGTYFHSGILAIRASVAAKTNITFKLLFNDAVAMTGGQPIDGVLTVPQLTLQLAAEGVARVAIVTEDEDRYTNRAALAHRVTVYHRDRLQEVETEFRAIRGTSIIIYDQTCATEKRRRRKRATMPEADRRIFINDRVCEGCGDCSRQSNCVSVLPLETGLGRKREIDQSNCNVDASCVKGFCPSFVSLPGATPRRTQRTPAAPPILPEPEIGIIDRPYGIVITGIGGTGVVTIGALLGIAAHIEGKAITVLDTLGFSQKGGGVSTQIRIGPANCMMASLKIPDGTADLILAFDNLLAANTDILKRLGPSTSAIVNLHEQVTPEFIKNPEFRNPTANVIRSLQMSIGGEAYQIDANQIAVELFGDTIAANMVLVGHAWQRGLIPLSREAIERAIDLNGAAVGLNKAAFAWGRASACEPSLLPLRAGPSSVRSVTETIDELVERLADELVAYQNEAYAVRYRASVTRVRTAEADLQNGELALSRTVAQNLYKLMAYKDEYEVARLYADPTFRQKLEAEFENVGRIELYLAPPLLSRTDPFTGLPIKRRFGPWILTAMELLARCRRLRGTGFDPFGYTAERRTERALVTEYEILVRDLAATLTHSNYPIALQLASLPGSIRGFGHVKAPTVSAARLERDRLLALYLQASPSAAAALAAE